MTAPRKDQKPARQEGPRSRDIRRMLANGRSPEGIAAHYGRSVGDIIAWIARMRSTVPARKAQEEAGHPSEEAGHPSDANPATLAIGEGAEAAFAKYHAEHGPLDPHLRAAQSRGGEAQGAIKHVKRPTDPDFTQSIMDDCCRLRRADCKNSHTNQQ